MTDERLPEIKLDPDDLYREELFTDRRAGTLRRLTPITAEGDDDPARAVSYVGDAQLMTPVGALPLSFEIPAQSLREALDKYPGAAREAMERAIEELKEMRREAASSIVIPEVGSGGGPGGLGGSGGIGGGKIHMP